MRHPRSIAEGPGETRPCGGMLSRSGFVGSKVAAIETCILRRKYFSTFGENKANLCKCGLKSLFTKKIRHIYKKSNTTLHSQAVISPVEFPSIGSAPTTGRTPG